jgi:REP element-mobilizing transposase RayT
MAKKSCRVSDRPVFKSLLVLRSSFAGGAHSFLKSQNKKAIEDIITRLTIEYGLRIYQCAVASNHLHLLVKIECRKSYKAFIRVLSGTIATHIMRGKSFKDFQKSLAGDGVHPEEIQGKGQKFWQFRPFGRVLFWGRDFKICSAYVVQNRSEAIGFLTYQPRRNFYSKWIVETLDPLLPEG